MTAKKRPSRYRVGRVSYYQHHGSWYLYYRDTEGIHRPRIGRSEAEAEKAAAIKNAELTAGEVTCPPQLTFAKPSTLHDLEGRSFLENAAALLSGLMQPRQES